LVGGTDNDWDIGDQYKVFPAIECTIEGGNVVALDENGDRMSPILSSTFTNISRESSTSAAIVVTGSGVTAQDKIDIIQGTWNEVLTTYNIPNSAADHLKKAKEGGWEDGAVWINQSSGNDANSGKVNDPVASISAAVTLAGTNNLTRLKFSGGYYEALSASLNGYQLISDDLNGNAMVDFNGQSVGNSAFRMITLTGTAGASDVFAGDQCVLYGPMVNLAGGFINCWLMGPTADEFVLRGGVSTVFDRCASASTGTTYPNQVPAIDCSAAALDVSFTSWNGHMKIVNMDDSDSYLFIDCVSGQIEIDSTCVDGTIRIRGNAIVIDNSGAGCAVINQTTVPIMWNELLTDYNIADSAADYLKRASEIEQIIIF
jgi:hypothetical protein